MPSTQSDYYYVNHNGEIFFIPAHIIKKETPEEFIFEDFVIHKRSRNGAVYQDLELAKGAAQGHIRRQIKSANDTIKKLKEMDLSLPHKNEFPILDSWDVFDVL